MKIHSILLYFSNYYAYRLYFIMNFACFSTNDYYYIMISYAASISTLLILIRFFLK